MKINTTKLILGNSMMIGVIMSICSNNWISMWMGLEISLLSFIPFIQSTKSASSESSMSYFIIQSMSSALLLSGVMAMLIGVNMVNETMVMLSMSMKLGVPPFHNWILMIIETMQYYTLFIFVTLTSIPPLTIISYIYKNNSILVVQIALSMMIGSILCLNQASIKKTIGYSSIFNMGLVLSLMNSNSNWIMYMTLYSLTMILLIEMLKSKKIKFINQMIFNEFNQFIKINIWVAFLSMGGFPPLLGFFPKILAVQSLVYQQSFMVLTILTMTSMLVMLFYLRISFSSMIILHSVKKWSEQNSTFNYSLFWGNMIFPVILSIKMIQ